MSSSLNALMSRMGGEEPAVLVVKLTHALVANLVCGGCTSAFTGAQSVGAVVSDTVTDLTLNQGTEKRDVFKYS